MSFDEFDLAPKGPKTDEIREKERQKELKQKGKVDRTAEYLNALKLINEITPLEINAGEIQDSILEDKFDLAHKQLEFRKYADKNKIPYNEADPTQIGNTYGNKKKERITLEKIPYDERNKIAAEIAGNKILQLIDILKIHYKDV